jgi:3-oxoadipate enol-lactonase
MLGARSKRCSSQGKTMLVAVAKAERVWDGLQRRRLRGSGCSGGGVVGCSLWVEWGPGSCCILWSGGAGSPLLLIHGMMITGEMFEPVLERLAMRHRVIVPDLRGYGRSQGLPPPYSAEQLADDLSRLLDHLGIGSAAVLGYSHGGAIAQQLALDHPGRCSRLVLACTYAFNMATFRERVEGHSVPLLVRLLGMKRFGKLVVSLGAKRLDKRRADWVAGLIGDQDAGLMIREWKEAMAFDSRGRLGEVR